MRGVLSAAEMTLVLNAAVGCVSPTKISPDRERRIVFLSPFGVGDGGMWSMHRFLPNSLLPDYEEVVNRPPTPPPPYSALHPVSPPLAPGPLGGEPQEAPPPPAAPPPDGPRPRPGLEEAGPGGGGGFLPKADDKSPGAITRAEGGEGGGGQRGGAGDAGKEPGGPGGPGEKRPLPAAGRRRRFTGDSGIEVCVCGARGGRGPGAEGEEGGEGGLLKELESLLGCTEDEEEAGGGGVGGGGGEFCESCGPRAHLREGEDEEEGEEEGEDEEAEDPEPAHRSGSGAPPPSIHQQEALPRGPQP
ncbi:unnamed protein product [Arctogadus glacialis]